MKRRILTVLFSLLCVYSLVFVTGCASDNTTDESLAKLLAAVDTLEEKINTLKSQLENSDNKIAELTEALEESKKENAALKEFVNSLDIDRYTVTWKNYDGTVLYVETNIAKGQKVEFKSETPARESDGTYSYAFAGWSPEISEVVTDITYVAQFNAQLLPLEIESSHQSGFYANPFALLLSTRKDATIFYTIDASAPDENSIRYTSPIEIYDVSQNPNVYASKDGISSIDVFIPDSPVDKCVVIRAVAIDSAGNRSAEICQTFFTGYNFKEGYKDVPIISLVVDPDSLYDYENGIYVTGKIYDESEHTGYPEQHPANYSQKGGEWERAANFTYFESDKTFSFSQVIGIRIHGGWSRAFNQKSFNLYARKEYSGTKTFEKAFFDTEKLQTCMLRSGGYRDTFVTKARDALNHELSKNESFAVQNSFPCILFLNGEYWGVYLLQERFTEHYVEEHYGVDKDNVVIIENGEVDEGEDSDIELYNELLDFFKNNDFSLAQTYEEAKKRIDVNEFAAYMSTELYIGNIDWPGNNVRMWRARDISDRPYEDGRWRFMMYDTDDSADMLPSKCHYDSDPFLNKNHWKDGPLDEDCILGLMLSKLLCNSDFSKLFIETFERIGSENFAPEKVNNYLDDMSEVLSKPMTVFYSRFVSDNAEVYNEAYYLSCIDTIKEFFANRYEYAMQYLMLHVSSE